MYHIHTPIMNHNGDIIAYFDNTGRNNLHSAFLFTLFYGAIMHDYKHIMKYYKISLFLSCNGEIKMLE
ncbi:hypothetical protein DWX43_12955 [Clostridium sp. AF19-22AC]|nr:hypothetical protein DWX43_12955 [Clostridium sp. AF19-22AC]